MHLVRTLLAFAAAAAATVACVSASEQDDRCLALVSDTNKNASVGAFADIQCLSDPSGVGCFDTACRFCWVTKTPVSEYFVACDPALRSQEDTPLFEAAGACSVSDGDRTAGLSKYYDASCASGGLGCEATNCRFCKVSASVSSPFNVCPSTGASPPAASSAPVSAPAPVPAPAVSSTCPVSPGDRGAGLSAFFDSGCANGGLGCQANNCRLCKVSSTVSSPFNLCPTSVSPPAPAPVPGPAPAVASTCPVSPGDQGAGLSAFYDSACANGGLGCQANNCRLCKVSSTVSSPFNLCPTSASPPAPAPAPGPAPAPAPAPAPGPAPPVSSACPVSPGDQGAGLSAYFDAACANGGLGCHANNCRLCKVSASVSSPFGLCPSGSAPSPATASVPTSAPATGSPACADAVARSGMTAVSFVTENQCNAASPGKVGCVPNTSCQLCRTGKNEVNQYLISCKVLQDSKTESASLESLDTASLNALFLAGEGEQQTSSEWIWSLSLFACMAAIVLAVVAVYKLKTAKRSKSFNAPCTPMNGSLIGLETCVSNL